MPSTYSDLKFELIATGEQSGAWGTTTNTNLGTAIEEAIVGRATANFTSDANLTLTLTDTNATQVARNYILNVTSGVSLTTTRDLIVPTIDKPYIIENNTTGSQSIVVKTAAGSGVTVPNGRKCMVYANSTNVVQASDYFPTIVSPSATITGGAISGASINTSSATITGGSISGITDLAIADGGTGASTAPDARTNLGATTVGSNLFTLTNPSAITFVRINADNTVSALSNSDFRTAIGVAIGTDVQAYDAELSAIAALAVTDGNVIVGNGSTWVAESGATARTSLGVGTGDNVQFSSFGVGTAASGTAGEIRATNNVTAYYTSDARLKENVRNIDNPLDMVSKINGVRYQWTDAYIAKNGGEDGYFIRKDDIGLIAQEVEAVLPEIVAENNEGFKAVKYDRVVALLIEAVKELTARVNELEKK